MQQADRASTVLPPIPRRRRRDWGRLFARAWCFVFALTGALPIALGFIVKSPWARGHAEEVTEKLLRDHAIVATYAVNIRLWPVALELKNLSVQSSDGGSPMLSSERVSIRPRFFALLSGKLGIDQIEVDAPKVRVVLRNGKLANLDVKLPESKAEGGPFHAPFNVISIADASVDVDIDGVHGTGSEIDLDVTADDDPERGSSFEIALRAGDAMVKNSHVIYSRDDQPVAVSADEDVLCALDGRLRIEPGTIIVRRFSASGSVDLDIAAETPPRCDLPVNDKRKVELALSHLRVRLPAAGQPVKVDGHIKARAPLTAAERLVNLPGTDGWLGVDADVKYDEDTIIPDILGHFEAHDIKLDRYRFAQEIQSDFAIRHNVITSELTTLRIADGVATFQEVTVEPLVKGVPIKMKLDIAGANFTTLMRDLGVSEHPHVAWDLRELHAPLVTGTAVPLKIDGDFVAQTGNFLVFDAAWDNPAHKRIIGVKEAGLRAHLAVRPLALQFTNVHAQLPTSTLDEGFVSIGFHNDLRVDVPKVRVDLADITPLADIPLAGQADIEAHVNGLFSDPHLEADATIQNFVFGNMPFGNVTQGHASLNKLVLDLKGIKAQKGKSNYEMPSARLDFGVQSGMTMDADVQTGSLDIRDFFSVFRMDDDPRFAEIEGTIASRATLRLALGGPQDVCGGGFLEVRAGAHVDNVKLYGESFDDGDVDLTYKWTDRLAGLAGADIDLRALTLHKVHPHGAGPVFGAVLGSGTIRRGGDITASLVLQSLPLSRVQSLGKVGSLVEGTMTGMLQVGGTLDSYTVQGDMDVSPLRVRGAAFGGSHVRVTMSQKPPNLKAVGKTRCGAPVYPLFDKDAYERDATSQGDYTFNGDLLGGELHLEHVTLTRQKAAVAAGKISLRKLNLGAVTQAMTPVESGADEAPTDSAPAPIEGELSGELVIDRLGIEDLGHASMRFTPTELVVSKGGAKLAWRPTPSTLVVDSDGLTLPPLVFDLESPNGLKGACTVHGTVTHVSRDPELGLSAELAPIDLGVLVGIVPKLERSQGSLSGSIAAKGKLRAPEIDGELRVRGGEFAVHGLPSVLSEVDVDVAIDKTEARIASATAKFAGGSIAVTGSVPIKGTQIGLAKVAIAARDIHVTPAEGMSSTFDADLDLALNPKGSGADALPHLTGDVLITSFQYTRPMSLEISALTRAKRTDIETYDPSLDALKLDVFVRTRAPLKIKNNLVEVQLGIDSNAVLITGTDQRFGLRGELKAQPGGRFHFRANDFDVRQAIIRFDDPTRIAPIVDVLAVTEYRRYTDTSAGAAAGAGAGTISGGQRAGGLWRISLHAYGDADNLRLDMTSDPPLSQEDIVLLLTIGMTRAEVDQLQAGSLGASAALEALATVSGADRAVKQAIPVIDDFRFGSAYSTQTGRTEPQVTVGKRLTDNLRANVSTGLAEDRELRSNIEWRLNQRISVQGSYDNINDVSSSAVGNVGVDFRWRLEFE
jgi:translocation and assembly module TamB